jgi:hypothetical protein
MYSSLYFEQSQVAYLVYLFTVYSKTWLLEGLSYLSPPLKAYSIEAACTKWQS